MTRLSSSIEISAVLCKEKGMSVFPGPPIGVGLASEEEFDEKITEIVIASKTVLAFIDAVIAYPRA